MRHESRERRSQQICMVTIGDAGLGLDFCFVLFNICVSFSVAKLSSTFAVSLFAGYLVT